MELVWDTVEIFAYVGWILALTFPLFVIAFIFLRRRYGKKLPSHRTMIVFVLVVICGGFCVYSTRLIQMIIDEVPGEFFIEYIEKSILNPTEILRQEPKFLLDSISEHQKNYFAEYNTYAGGSHDDSLCIFRIFSVKLAMHDFTFTAGESIYSYYCGEYVIPAAISLKKESVVHDPETNWPDGASKPAVSQSGYTCVAIGDIDNDDTFDIYSISYPSIIGAEYSEVLVHEIDDTGDDGTRSRGSLTLNGRVYLNDRKGGIYFYVLGMLTPFLLLSIAIDIVRAARLRREGAD